MSKNNFLYNSFFIVIVNFIVMLLDFNYNIALSKYIGAEGMGLFQIGLSILMVPLVISTGGIPTAISKLVAEQNSKKNKYAIEKILKIAFLLVFILLGIVIGLLATFSNIVAMKVFKNKNMVSFIYLLIPAIIFISINSILRGYYYGLKIVKIPNVSNIIEHATRILIVLSLLNYLHPISPIYGATIALIGISIGEVFNLIYLVFMKRKITKPIYYNIHTKINSRTILKEIIYISLPITIYTLLNILLRFVNTVLIPEKLIESGFSSADAIATFGRITGMAMPLISLPFIITSAMGTLLIPNLAQEMALKKYSTVKNQILISIKITLLFSIPLAGMYVFFHKTLAIILYNDIQVSNFIYILGFNTVLLALQSMFSSILHGLNKQATVTINRIIGMCFQLLSIYFLVGNFNMGINGFFVGFYLSSLTTLILDCLALKRIMKLNTNYKDLILKPLIATACMLISIYFCQNYKFNTPNNLFLIFSFITGIFIYISVLYITKAIPIKK